MTELTHTHLHGDFAAGTPFDPALFPAVYPPDLPLEPVHSRIELALDLAQSRARGSVIHTVTARRAGAQSLALHAVALDIAAVADEEGYAVTWHYTGDELHVRWLEGAPAGAQRRLRIDYSVEQPAAGLYFSQPSAAYPDAPWYAVTDHETERARHWLPCVDLPAVRTALDLHLRTEERFTIIANGLLVGDERHADGTHTAHWRLEERCPSYLVCFAVGDLVRADDGAFVDELGGGRAIACAYFCSPAHTPEHLLNSFGRTKAMLGWLTRRLNRPFPYPKYFQFALPGVNGAMENISLVSWDEKYVLDGTLAPEWTWLVDAVNIHEMSHSYFGDAVVCRDFAHAWLKESWATFIEQVYREETVSADEGLYVFYQHAQAYLTEADTKYKRPLVTRHWASSWDLYDRHLYPGGACRLHMLRRELGDEVFWAAVSDYLARYEGQVVETDHFRHVLEAHSGRALGRFFDQWIHSPGYPDLHVTFQYDADAATGRFTIEQKQVDPAAGIPCFHFSTSVGWTIDGHPYTQAVAVEAQRTVVTAPMTARPQMVRFDPGCSVLHKLSFNPGDGLLRTQLFHAPDVLGRIHAANELCKTGKRANIEAVVSAYRQEPHWGVRIEMAAALGAANHNTAITGLAGLLAFETDPLVLGDLLKAAGRYRDPAIAAAVQALLAAGVPPLARQAAYEALGAQREDAPLEQLREAALTPGVGGVVQAGAIRGLAATRRPEAVAPLLELAREGGSSVYVRHVAGQQLGVIGQYEEKRSRAQIVDRLGDLLRDPHHRLGAFAADAAITMQATELIPALERYAQAHNSRFAAVARRAVAKLRQNGSGAGPVRELEALQKKVRELAEKIEELQGRDA